MIPMGNRNEAGVGRGWRGRAFRPARGAVALLALALASACDLQVTDPNRVEDDYLNNPDLVPSQLFPLLYRGAMGDFVNMASGSAGSGGVYVAGALLTDELVHSGVRPGFRSLSRGAPDAASAEVNELWAEASRARVNAELGIARMERLTPPETPATDVQARGAWMAIGSLFAGFSNRVMGDAFCEAVIDKGPTQPHTEFYLRADSFFTKAIRYAEAGQSTTWRTPAVGGRAQTRMMLGDWAGAVADAAQIPTAYVFNQDHTDDMGASRRQANFQRVVTRDVAETTSSGTPFADLGRTLRGTAVVRQGDPRVVMEVFTDRPLGLDGQREFVAQRKHLFYSTDVGLVRGTEMRLIEAEALLLQKNVTGAVAKINEVRTFRNSAAGGLAAADRKLPMVAATTEAAAWNALMQERAIELWLEGRRLPDLRRWQKTPGFVNTTVVREGTTRQNVLQTASPMCIPVGSFEDVSNPHR